MQSFALLCRVPYSSVKCVHQNVTRQLWLVLPMNNGWI